MAGVAARNRERFSALTCADFALSACCALRGRQTAYAIFLPARLLLASPPPLHGADDMVQAANALDTFHSLPASPRFHRWPLYWQRAVASATLKARPARRGNMYSLPTTPVHLYGLGCCEPQPTARIAPPPRRTPWRPYTATPRLSTPALSRLH